MKTKHLLFLAAILLASLQGFSQPTLTFANSGVEPGDVLTMVDADTAGVVTGSAGASQTWNYTSLDIGSTPTSTTYVDPVSTPYASSFPTATAATSAVPWAYTRVNSSEFTILGEVNSNATIIYSDPETMLNYPLSYNGTSTDNFAASFVSGVNWDRTGTITTTADGWGTLILPSGSYNSLRIKLVQDITDVSTYGNMIFHSESYVWYDGINITPLLEIIISSTEFMGNSTTTKNVFVSAAAAGIDTHTNIVPAISIFPNPASDVLNLTVESVETTDAEISILDVQGKVIIQANYYLNETGMNQFTFDIADLTNGIYFVRISTSKGMLYKKMMIE